MTNSEKNKLIEKFMGWELKWISDYDSNQWCFVNKHTGKTISGMYCNSELPYCTDWNWLIEAIAIFDSTSNLKSKSQILNCSVLCSKIYSSVLSWNISDAVNALCDGIEWYNSLKINYYV